MGHFLLLRAASAALFVGGFRLDWNFGRACSFAQGRPLSAPTWPATCFTQRPPGRFFLEWFRNSAYRNDQTCRSCLRLTADRFLLTGSSRSATVHPWCASLGRVDCRDPRHRCSGTASGSTTLENHRLRAQG